MMRSLVRRTLCRFGLRACLARFVLVALAVLAIENGSRPAAAHEASMAVMVVREVAPGTYMTNWSLEPTISGVRPTFPAHCQWTPPDLVCGERGLSGRVTVEGLGANQSAMMLRVIPGSGPTQAYTLTSARPVAMMIPGNDLSFTAFVDIAETYISLGIDHILRGVDHLMFVLGLIWLVRSTRMLIGTITSFTMAHSFSLAAATFGWVGVPERPLNAAIALSIVFLGVEIVKQQRGNAGLTATYPWIVAFGFGLLHGLGFATALTNLGIPQSVLPWALLFFNVGVEIGQIAFVLLVLALMWAHHRADAVLPRYGAMLPAYGIGSIAAFWFLLRI